MPTNLGENAVLRVDHTDDITDNPLTVLDQHGTLPSPPVSEFDGLDNEQIEGFKMTAINGEQNKIKSSDEEKILDVVKGGQAGLQPFVVSNGTSVVDHGDLRRGEGLQQLRVKPPHQHTSLEVSVPETASISSPDQIGPSASQTKSSLSPMQALGSPLLPGRTDLDMVSQPTIPCAASSSVDRSNGNPQLLHMRGDRETSTPPTNRKTTIETGRAISPQDIISPQPRPAVNRAFSTPGNTRNPDLTLGYDQRQPTTKPRTTSKSDHAKHKPLQHANGSIPSPIATSIPLPPLSLPTYLQLELSSHRPSQLYIHRSESSTFPYESSRVKIERLLNFLFLPHQLESVLWFGTLACLDSWLYTFTILPLRLLKSLYILGQSWMLNFLSELHFVFTFVYSGTQRMWQRRQRRRASTAHDTSRKPTDAKFPSDRPPRIKPRETRNHRRNKSTPSMLLPDDKADILKSLLIIFTCLILLRLDASRMYHWVRGQAAIKLYVIYNVLEVCDRLLSAIGQDVLECLFSQEALERKPDGHSKILRPFWLFILALCYTTLHATALFYQVVTLNVAVNSYSNALITLLMSNQFVEIKSTVFKKFEKENLFQLTCADIVERFQLWHMLMIIAARNIVETGGLNLGLNALASPISSSTIPSTSNSSNPVTQAVPPLSVSSILPRSFTLVPSLLNSLTAYVPTIGHVIGPFIIVLGSEMLIDWLKHAYINKFNNTKPIIYGRFLDILAKDYYTNAFGDQNLTKRFGLPVIPLSCLMIRATFQTYQMFVAAWLPAPAPSSASLASIHEQYSASRALKPTSTAAAVARQINELLYQIPSTITNSAITSHFTTMLILLLIFLVLLACKLILGMVLLAFARSRYRAMKERERNPTHFVEGGRRVGGWGVVEVDEDKRRWIYDDDPNAMRNVKERENREASKREVEKDKGGNVEGLDKVKRYEMVAKRIW